MPNVHSRNPVEVIPAILPRDFAELKEKLARVASVVSLVQIDVCDGKFVPSRTWPYGKYDDNFEKILGEEEGMPYWEDLDFEIDLMVKNPEEVIADWVRAGARRIVVHFESLPDFGKFLEWWAAQYGTMEDSLVSVELVLAIGLETEISKILPYLNRVSAVELMGIARIGYQGESFDPRVLSQISTLRKSWPNGTISVDGGVNFETAPLLIKAGADRLISGSAVFESENIIDAIRRLQSL